MISPLVGSKMEQSIHQLIPPYCFPNKWVGGPKAPVGVEAYGNPNYSSGRRNCPFKKTELGLKLKNLERRIRILKV